MRALATLAVLAVLPSCRLAALQCPDGAPPPCAGQAARNAGQPTSVAVLYFENLSRDTADLYLADGITEELTSRLGAVARLRVTGRSVVRRAQQTAGGDALAVGRGLNVRYLVEGSLRRSGPRVRVSVRLLRASDGVRVWGDDYDRTMDDLLALQEDIARQVAASVAGQLLPGERSALAARPTTSPEAYDHYLRGRYLYTRRTVSAITQAAAEFTEALRLDPRFAAAEARLATTLALAYGYGAPLASDDSLAARARRSAERALQLDSTASDAWLAMAAVRFWFQPIEVDAALAAMRHAITLDPRNAEAQHALGVMLQSLQEDSAAVAAFQRALALEPTRGVTLLDMAEVRYAQRRFAEARLLVDSAIVLDPLQSRPFWLRGALRRTMGDIAGGRTDAETALRQSAPKVRMYSLAQMIGFDLLAHDTASARARLAEMEASPLRVAIAHALALAHFGLLDSAMAVLARGPIVPIDWSGLPMPEFDPLRSLPGYPRAVEAWRLRRPRS
jgi:TolB-like protein/Tfp pilus assembly protein PilF